MEKAFREYKPLLLVGALYAALLTGLAAYCGAPFAEYILVVMAVCKVVISCSLFIFIFCAGTYVRDFLRCFLRGGELAASFKSAGADFGKRFRGYLRGDVFPYAVMGIVVLCCNSFFYVGKPLIPYLNPYHWDPELAAIDRAVHFGYYPHRLIVPMIDKMRLGYLLDTAYWAWLLVMFYVAGYNVFFDTNMRRRLQFIWVFLLSWIFIGFFLAVAFSSVGPIFYADFYSTSPDIYADLKSHFMQGDGNLFVVAGNGYRFLMEWARNDKMLDPNAISAMPSMHVAIAVLIAFYARAFNRVLFALSLVFLALILLGAVYFGFHYAIDGYVSMALVALMWWGIGRILDKKYPKEPRQDLKILL